MTEALAEGFVLPPVSPSGLVSGEVIAFPAPEIAEAEATIERVEIAVAESRASDALATLGQLPSLAAYPPLALRALLAESWARMTLGDLDAALSFAERARVLTEDARFDDVDRAEALFRLGCCHLKLAHVSVAASLFGAALGLCERSGATCERLRAHAHEWRSRCHQRHREWEAARADAERALELAASVGDRHLAAHAQFQASLVAERTGQHLLARFYAEEAKAGYEQAGDRLMLARTLNNLGGLTFLLGDHDDAVAQLVHASTVAVAAGSEADAAQAASSLAQVHLRSGRPDLAERLAQDALTALAGRVDFLDEIGNAQLVLGRALLAQDRHDEAAACLREAETSFERLGSASHRAAVWVAQGDLASAAGTWEDASSLYRRAAEALQDFHF